MDQTYPPLPDLFPDQDDADDAEGPVFQERLEGFENVELEDQLARRAPRRHLLARSALVLGALVVVLGVLLRGALPLAQWAAPQRQVNASTLWTPGTVNIYSNVSYGTITLNGRRLHGPPPQRVAGLPTGPNTLTLDAPPFPRVTCLVSVIGASDDGSDAYRASDPCSVNGAGGRVNIIVLLSGANLPPTVAARALSTLRLAVSQAPAEYADVPAGEYYATGQDASGAITYARATQPLVAWLEYSADTRGAPADSAPGSSAPAAACFELACASGDFESRAGQAAWLVSEPVLLTMRFHTADGQDMGAISVPGTVPMQFALAIRPDGTWQTVNLGSRSGGWFGQPEECEIGAHFLAAALTAAHIAEGGMAYGFDLGHGALVGCQIAVAVGGVATSALFIWRFGVLLAADASAHALMPALPLAPPSAIRAIATPTS